MAGSGRAPSNNFINQGSYSPLMPTVGQLLSRKDESVIPNGTYVKHSTKPIQGRVIGVTRIKKLFERANDAFEYRFKRSTT
jgi:hypothetical protein